MHAAHHYSHYNYAATAAAQQYSHLMASAGGFPMNPAMYHAAAATGATAAQPDRSNAGTPHPAAVAAAAAANPAGQHNSHAHAATAAAAVAGHHMYPPGYPNYLNYR